MDRQTNVIGTPPDSGSGKLIGRRYRIRDKLSETPLSTVYSARDEEFTSIKRLVIVEAIRVPMQHRTPHDRVRLAFHYDVRGLMDLKHPNIINVRDVLDSDDGRNVYVVTDYINGSDLVSILGKTRFLPVEKMIEWTADLSRALHHMHTFLREPYLFGNLEPNDIMIDSLGRPLLVGFNLAETFADPTQIGRRAYEAPESLLHAQRTPRSDQYALAAAMHHVLTRQDPRPEQPFTFHERPVRDHNPDVPQWFADIIQKALAFDLGGRFESCAAMAAAIQVRQADS